MSGYRQLARAETAPVDIPSPGEVDVKPAAECTLGEDGLSDDSITDEDDEGRAEELSERLSERVSKTESATG